MIKQQVGLTKSFNDPVRRITVLIRAADLLWPYEQEKASAIFKEAFELATEHEKEQDQNSPRAVILRLQVPDQRYVVLRAVARRDSSWANELTQQMVKAANNSEGSSKRSSFENMLTAERLLDSAKRLLSTDTSSALDFAKLSLNYPASSALTHFLYRFAEVNQPAANRFYAQALTVYGDKPIREFLYLEAYPFGLRESNNTPSFASYVVPTNFLIDQSLQRRFVQVLLGRVQQALESPLDEGDNYRNIYGTLMPGTAHLLQALMRIEPQVRASLPDLFVPLTQAREKILVSLPVETQKMLLQPGREVSTTPEQTFEEQIELAQKESDVNARDDLIATAVLSESSKKPSLAEIVQAIEKISESSLRTHLLEWLYFHRAITAIQEKHFEEAEKLTARVDGHEQRAYLHINIAKELLNGRETQTHGREVLDEAITEARKAGTTIFAARTLLTASNLYAKIDLSQSISVLAEAINCINRIEAPDFFSDDQALERTPKRRVRGGKYGGEYALRFYMPGLDPETAFREMAKIDFDTSLSQSIGLTDKFQRAISTLALAEGCLQQAQKQPKQNPRRAPSPESHPVDDSNSRSAAHPPIGS